MPDFTLEDDCASPSVAGVDEAGRGPWAGPVVAAAVILDRARPPLERLDDSKRLGRRRRQALAERLHAEALVGIGVAEVAEITALNVLQASLLAMKRAVAALPCVPDHVLVDGRQIPENLPCPARAVIGGDHRCFSIAAASVVAKVHRDALMTALAAQWPGYGWERNMGYGTREHAESLHRLGATPHHRPTFRPVRQRLTDGEQERV